MPDLAADDRGDTTVTVTELPTFTPLAERALEALAAREAEQAAELARLAAERAEHLEHYAREALRRVTGTEGCITWATPDRRPYGWELAFTVDELDLVLVDHDGSFPTLHLIDRCPQCAEPRESVALADLADLGSAIRDGDVPCLHCLGPEWTDAGPLRDDLEGRF